MKLHQSIQCPQCLGKTFSAKYESTYLYSYKIKASENNNEEENLPFLFDNRQQKHAKQYIECDECGAKYPCEFKMDSKQLDFTILQKSIRGDHAEKPEFFG